MRVMSLHERERAIADVQLASAEVISFDDVGRELLPAVTRMLDCSGQHMYRSEAECPLVAMAGNELRAICPEYVVRYMPEDPLQVAAYRENPWILHLSRTPEWRAYVRHPAHDFLSGEGFKFLLHVRLAEGRHCEPGMVGMLLSRSGSQQDFSDDDVLAVARVLPALQSAARRCSRTLAAVQTKGALEAVLDDEGRLAFDVRGRLLWMSPRAARWLGDGVGTARRTIEEAAARLGAAASGEACPELPRFTVAVRGDGGAPLRAHLRIGRSGTGEPFVIVDLEPAGSGAAAVALADRFALTRAEAEVLTLLASGLRDREIAQKTATSQHTVRTHVGRILSKLGVRSRLEAALAARGVSG